MSEYFYYQYINAQITNKGLQTDADRKLNKQNSITGYQADSQLASLHNNDYGNNYTRQPTNRTAFEANGLRQKYEILKQKSMLNIESNSAKGETELRKKLAWDKEGHSIEVI